VLAVVGMACSSTSGKSALAPTGAPLAEATRTDDRNVEPTSKNETADDRSRDGSPPSSDVPGSTTHERELAYVLQQGVAYRLFTANADGSDAKPVSTLLDVSPWWGIAVSGDGSQVAVVARETASSPWGLYRVDVADGAFQRLTDMIDPMDTPEDDRAVLIPVWSEGDEDILYTFLDEEKPCQAISPDGSQARTILRDYCILGLVFSRSGQDGDYFGVFGNSLLTFPPEALGSQNPDDAEILAEVISDEMMEGWGGLGVMAAQASGYMRPAMSPDGETIAYGTFFTDVYVIPLGGGEPRLVRTVPGERSPVAVLWDPSGESLIVGELGEQPIIERIDVETGAAQPLIIGGPEDVLLPVWVTP
jgi:hypothetical protein